MLLLSGGLPLSRGLLFSKATQPTRGGGDLDAESGEAGQRVTSRAEAWGLPTPLDTYSEDHGTGEEGH